MIIADITKAHPGTEKFLLNTLKQQNERGKLILVFCLFAQLSTIKSLSDLQIQKTYDILDHDAVTHDIFIFIGELLKTADQQTVSIYSFHRNVLLLRKFFPENIETLHWPKANKKPSQWPEQFMPLQEAISKVAMVLEELEATDIISAIRASELRGYLTGKDKRFDKNYPGANSPGLISSLIDEAQSKGLLTKELKRNDPNAYIYMAKPTERPISNSKKIIESSISGMYIDVLSKNNLGPFSRIRNILFQELSAQINKQNHPTANEAINGAINSAKEYLTNNQKVHNGFPWRKVRVFLVTLLSRNAILKGNTEYFHYSFTTSSELVFGLQESWIEILESDLIYALVQHEVNIHIADIPQLSGAIFLSREDKEQDRINQLIMRLINEKKLVDDHGILKINIPDTKSQS